MPVTETDILAVGAIRRRQATRRRIVLAILAILVLAAFATTLMAGKSFVPPLEVIQILLGADMGGANFTVGTLRLPRAVLSVVAGLSFGLGGAAFQTLLRNPLASPDIIGISSSASAAAVFAIVVLSLDGAGVAFFAVTASLVVAGFIFVLSFRRSGFGARLILTGIGVAAICQSIIYYVLSRAPVWDAAEALRWLTGSVNGAAWGQIGPAALVLVIAGSVLLSRARALENLRLGEDTAAALGERVNLSRVLIIMAAVALIAFATAAAGPVAFVAFLSGPIATRLVGHYGSALIPSALTGALLVLVADFAGQYLLGARFPVGVVTGALGAPYLIYLIVVSNRAEKT
ncbi:iron ABC transporter permease [Devosia sp. MSA67]|uniref:Iron ABC transporter permease n=1 Tax=Devosia sediminis TaxID=2798801 RepID=A0A934MRJ3_9HYPH|nr:iron ABC transporter permease [Devosia sediminis]MBJ3785479.1 iron ABC transporter permease [Devosia sediminis]